MKTLKMAQVTEALKATPLEVKRLIARRRLPATQLGEGGDWVVDDDNLSKYITTGAQDFDMPPIDGKWFLSRDEMQIEHFRQEATNAAMSQRRSPEQIQAMLAGDKLASTFDVPLKMTPEILAACQKPAINPAFRVPGKVSAFKDVREALGANLLQWLARYIVNKPLKLNPLDELYSSPEAYDGYVSAAMEQFLARYDIMFADSHSRAAGGGARINYLLKNDQLADADVQKRLIQVAF